MAYMNLIPAFVHLADSLAYQVSIAYHIFISVAFPQTIRYWNALPDSLISSAEGAEDGVGKFTSLVSAGD